MRLVALATLISVSSFSQNQDNTSPTVSLTDSDSDNLVYSSNVVTITATFSEAMSSTPTISITGEISNALMLPGNDIVLKQTNGWVSSSGRFNTNSNNRNFLFYATKILKVIRESIKVLLNTLKDKHQNNL